MAPCRLDVRETTRFGSYPGLEGLIVIDQLYFHITDDPHGVGQVHG